MKLIDGKFYEDNQEVPMEIGNTEQIKLLKKIGAIRDIDINNEGIEPINLDLKISEKTTSFDVSASFKCVCGKKIETNVYVEVEDDEDEDDAIKEALEDEVISCRVCDREYTIIDGKAELNESD